MFDLIIRQALTDQQAEVDIGIQNGRIAAIETSLPADSGPEIQAAGRMVMRGYVDPHMHLDKAFLAQRAPNVSGTLDEAIQVAGRLKREATRTQIQNRALRTVQMALRNGVTAIRTHVDVDPIAGLDALKALLEIRETMKRQITIQIVAFPQEGLAGDENAIRLLEQALNLGADVLGGIPARDPDPGHHLDTLFNLAKAYEVPLDLHVDESDDPADFTLPLVIERTLRTGMEGRVAVGHCCSLSAVSDDLAEKTMADLAAVGIAVITLPSTNLYLQGRGDRGNIRRGITRVKELVQAGVTVTAGSDNLRDPFNPFGNANPIETAWLLAHVAHMGGLTEMEAIFAMVTKQAAAVMGLREWKIRLGDPANLVILDAGSPADALISMARPAYRICGGTVVQSPN
jgi:cytosine deaminase